MRWLLYNQRVFCYKSLVEPSNGIRPRKRFTDMKNNTSKYFVTVGAAFALVFGVFMAVPPEAHAFQLGQLIDPGCFFACSSGGGGHKTINNYGNYRSPGGVVVTGDGSITVNNPAPTQVVSNPIASNPIITNNNYNYNNTNSVPIQNTPVYSYNVNPAPVYTYPSVYSYDSQPTVVQPVFVQQASPFIQQPTVYVQQYSPVYVSCSVNTTFTSIGTVVTWSAYATGGDGYYTYSWSGSDGFYASGQFAYFTYQFPGYKTASVTVYSNGQSYTQNCSNAVTVNAPVIVAQQVVQPIPVVAPRASNFNGLDVGCYADPINATPNQPVTWSVEVTGGIPPYSYSWTGSDGLTGAAASVIKFYKTSGAKSAIVTVTSADGRNTVHACSNTVTVRSYGAPAPKPVVQQPQPASTTTPTPNNNGLSASAFFSLATLPWGWISVLIILLLLGTVLYLMFNKTKI